MAPLHWYQAQQMGMGMGAACLGRVETITQLSCAFPS